MWEVHTVCGKNHEPVVFSDDVVSEHSCINAHVYYFVKWKSVTLIDKMETMGCGKVF